jgi:C4-dicarboxylate-specific signal transduction histidine kinase
VIAATASPDRTPGPGRVRGPDAVDRIAAQIASQLDLDQLAHLVVMEVQHALDAEAASVLLLEGDSLRFLEATGPAASTVVGLTIPAHRGICGEVMRRGEAVLARDGQFDTRVARDFASQVEASTGFESRSIVAAPLWVQGRVIGVVEAVNRRGQPGIFNDDDLAFLDRLAPHVAAAISNALFAAELRRSRDELARHAEELEARVQERTRQIAAAKREWELTFDSIHEPIAIVEGHVLRRSNLAYARVSGVGVREVPGSLCHEVRFGRREPCPGCPVAAARAAGSEADEAELELGGEIVVARAYRLHDEERPDAWVVGYTDVTEERRMAARLREAEHLSAIGRLAAGAAHEINNPMAFLSAGLRTFRRDLDELHGLVRSAAEAPRIAERGDDRAALTLLRDLVEQAEAADVGGLLREAHEVLDEAEEGTRRITSIVQALKVLGREERGTDESMDLAVVLERAADRARKLVVGAGTVRWAERGEARVLGRPLQLDQALFEVVRNALQTGTSVELAVGTEGECAFAEVRDAGPGMTADVRQRVFEPFFTTRGVGGGVGLGLTIAYGVVRRLGGEILLLPGLTGGTTVRLELPSTNPDRGLDSPGPR